MKRFRACYYDNSAKGGVGILLTLPEQSDLPDDQLIEEAVAEAYRGNIVQKGHPADEPYLSEDDLRSGLRIGEWQEN